MAQQKPHPDFIPDEEELHEDFIPDEPDESDIPEIVSSNRARLPAADNFGSGFMRSLLNGEALETGLKGAKGYLKGATLDIPDSIRAIPSTLKTGYDLINPSQWIDHNPIDTMRSIGSGLRNMYDTTMQSGSEPEAFGRMMGQTTGQPLVTEGLIKATSPAVRGTGSVVSKAGKVMEKYTPLSTATGAAVGGATGGIPGAMLGTMRPFTKPLRFMERGVGKGLQNVGDKMRGIGRKEPTSSLFDTYMPNESGHVSPTNGLNEAMDFGPSPIDPLMPNESGYRTNPTVEESIDFGQSEIDPFMPNKSGYTGNSVGDAPGSIADQILQSEQPEIQLSKPKPKVRLNRDGTFTNTETGEVIDQSSKGGKTLTKVYSTVDPKDSMLLDKVYKGLKESPATQGWPKDKIMHYATETVRRMNEQSAR